MKHPAVTFRRPFADGLLSGTWKLDPTGPYRYWRLIRVCLRGHTPDDPSYVRSLGPDPYGLTRQAAEPTITDADAARFDVETVAGVLPSRICPEPTRGRCDALGRLRSRRRSARTSSVGPGARSTAIGTAGAAGMPGPPGRFSMSFTKLHVECSPRESSRSADPGVNVGQVTGADHQ